ncbi:Ig-like domain-containing protein [Rhodococcus antarcticus]|uniref:Ig-like domain-containing protein n=1 Tax=Rhodococcus antarcticus TaxID=2987751 RepID=A0ABY6NVI0_9NOCA|nr:Ig-like domain-containing protein [Rhodococcus antarcticus]UZJ23400.1 Ig-like domain-containing protein [Rhodococcus antarcticus]
MPPSRRRHRRHASLLVVALAGVVATVVVTGRVPMASTPSAAVTSAPTTTTPTTPAPTTVPARPAAVSVTPGWDASGVDVLAPVAVTATNGVLSRVTLIDDTGAAVDGTMTPNGLSWNPTGPLAYTRTYTVTAQSTGVDGTAATTTSTFSTLAPANQTKVYFRTTGGGVIGDDRTYGVGMIVVAHFDEHVPDRAAAQKLLTVTTNPPVTGAWNWVSDTDAHWRPEKYYAPDTTVRASATVFGKAVGGGLYGQEDTSASFTVGASHVSIADDTTKQVEVYDNGTLVRTMPTSMGMGGSEVIDGQTISFWTQRGTYTVLDKANPVVMDSSTFGLPVNSRLGYKESINWATRISNDGIYLHQLDATVPYQGNTDTSHGCLNLNQANAQWFFDYSIPGDIVQVKNTGGSPLTVAQNGDWSLSWADWQAGSAY